LIVELGVSVGQIYDVVTCEMKWFRNNFEIISVFYFICDHVWIRSTIISALWRSSKVIWKLFQRYWICWQIFV